MAEEVAKTGIAKATVDVLFDDVEGEVVGPAEGPDGNHEQKQVRPRKILNQQRNRREETQKNEEEALGDNGGFALEVAGKLHPAW